MQFEMEEITQHVLAAGEVWVSEYIPFYRAAHTVCHVQGTSARTAHNIAADVHTFAVKHDKPTASALIVGLTFADFA